MELSQEEILKYAIQNGIINTDTIQKQIEMNERKKYIKNHCYKIWEGKDNKWYTYLPNGDGRKLVKRTSEKSIHDVVVSFYREQEESPTIENVYREWINEKLEYGEISKQTYDRYNVDFERFFTKIKERKIQYFSEIELEKFIKSTIHEFNLTVKSWGGLRIIIRGMFKYAKKRNLTEISITNFLGDLDLSSKIFAKNKINDDEQVFTRDEIKLIKRHINTYKNKETEVIDLGILLAIQTGLRVGELSAIKYSDLHGCELYVRRMEISYKENEDIVYEVVEHNKTEAGTRDVYLTKEAIAIIQKAHRQNPFGEYLFMKNGKRILSRRYSDRLRRICKQVGIKQRSLHKLRKTYATNLLNGNVDEKIVQKQMGHSNISTTMSYYYYDDKSKEQRQLQIENAINF